jgi:hypothetical protein
MRWLLATFVVVLALYARRPRIHEQQILKLVSSGLSI